MRSHEFSNIIKTIQLRVDRSLGDYSGEVVDLLKGDGEYKSPRGSGPTLQYFVSWGQSQYERDWIAADFLNGSIDV
jgi:hypothetical protein